MTGISEETFRARVNRLFDAIKHGDDEHQAWLKEAIECHYSGRPVPPAIGMGTKERLLKDIDQLEKTCNKLAAMYTEALFKLDRLSPTHAVGTDMTQFGKDELHMTQIITGALK